MQDRVKKGLKSIGFPVLSVIVAFLLAAIFLAAMGYNVFDAYKSLIKGAFGDVNAISETLIQVTPLLFCAISYAIAYRCGMINLGAEGQLTIGAIVGSVVGAHLHLPIVLHAIVTLLCGFLGGALYGLLVGVLKMRFAASELITTIMLNYIALEFASFCVNNAPFRDMTEGAAPRMAMIDETSMLPRIFPAPSRVHLGIVLAIIGVVVYYLFMWRTTRGYEMRVIGMNMNAGRYSGMNIRTNSILSMFLAGGFAGVGGIVQIMGLTPYFTDTFSNNFGFSGIAVALLGNCHPAGMVASAVLFGALNAGGKKMEMLAHVPNASIYMIQGMIILFAVSRELFIWFSNGGKHVVARIFGKKEGAAQ